MAARKDAVYYEALSPTRSPRHYSIPGESRFASSPNNGPLSAPSSPYRVSYRPDSPNSYIIGYHPTKLKKMQSASFNEELQKWKCKHCDHVYDSKPDHRQRRIHKKICPGQDSGDFDESLEQNKVLEAEDFVKRLGKPDETTESSGKLKGKLGELLGIQVLVEKPESSGQKGLEELDVCEESERAVTDDKVESSDTKDVGELDLSEESVTAVTEDDVEEEKPVPVPTASLEHVIEDRDDKVEFLDAKDVEELDSPEESVIPVTEDDGEKEVLTPTALVEHDIENRDDKVESPDPKDVEELDLSEESVKAATDEEEKEVPVPFYMVESPDPKGIKEPDLPEETVTVVIPEIREGVLEKEGPVSEVFVEHEIEDRDDKVEFPDLKDVEEQALSEKSLRTVTPDVTDLQKEAPVTTDSEKYDMENPVDMVDSPDEKKDHASGDLHQESQSAGEHGNLEEMEAPVDYAEHDFEVGDKRVESPHNRRLGPEEVPKIEARFDHWKVGASDQKVVTPFESDVVVPSRHTDPSEEDDENAAQIDISEAISLDFHDEIASGSSDVGEILSTQAHSLVEDDEIEEKVHLEVGTSEKEKENPIEVVGPSALEHVIEVCDGHESRVPSQVVGSPPRIAPGSVPRLIFQYDSRHFGTEDEIKREYKLLPDDNPFFEKPIEEYVPEKPRSQTITYDLPKLLQEQTTHDLVCPICTSRITSRIILRRKRRTFVSKERAMPQTSPEITLEIHDEDTKIFEDDDRLKVREAQGAGKDALKRTLHELEDSRKKQPQEKKYLSYILPRFVF